MEGARAKRTTTWSSKDAGVVRRAGPREYKRGGEEDADWRKLVVKRGKKRGLEAAKRHLNRGIRRGKTRHAKT